MKTKELLEKWDWEKPRQELNSIVILDSVGCVLHTDSLLTWPQGKHSSIDEDNTVPLFECTDEWWNKLSYNDQASMVKVLDLTIIDRLTSITIGDVVMADYPDFSDAYLESAYSSKLDRWLTHEEMENSDFDVSQYIHENMDLYR